ncbi:hypothetical protein D1823_03240 [Ruegeria sp. AD91A]|uniref:hypothetical protein n=1 Tax=Ruegeria sp. AD91A TaxID=2293862 RepID=UPI000E4E3DC5|nr:hypothetical protein [Ruegeria sp. AD91A]AXT25692.1 hypothetical protein D1823_03240 [Ruegeria sp. AD91A]
MTHADAAAHLPKILPGTVLAIVLAGLLGFAVGQSRPVVFSGPQDQVSPTVEDWHGNVRRSHWSE